MNGEEEHAAVGPSYVLTVGGEARVVALPLEGKRAWVSGIRRDEVEELYAASTR